MSIILNAFPLRIPTLEIKACQIAYDKETLDGLRVNHSATHAFRRQDDSILFFSSDGTFPISGKLQTIALKNNFSIFYFLIKDGLNRHLAKLKRNPSGFNPIELVSTRARDNLLDTTIGEDYPFKVCAKYSIDTRTVKDNPCLVIDCTTRRVIKDNCAFFLDAEFDLINRYVATEQDNGYRKLLGAVSSYKGKMLFVTKPDGSVVKIEAGSVYLEANLKNLDDYILHTHGVQKDTIVERIRQSVSAFNRGENKKARIDTFKKYIQSNAIALINGTRIEIEDASDIQRHCEQMQKPVFIFNDSVEANLAEKGLTQSGPYTKRTFDRNNPSICVICAQHEKGRVEQFVRKLLKDISNSRYFSSGLEGKFALGTSRVEIFTTATDNIDAYKHAIEDAIRKKEEEDDGRWDLALVQVRQSFKNLKVTENPYYMGKNLFFRHKIPVQDFTIELLEQQDNSLGYSLNNMALACYAKLGGIPWLLKSSPTLSHELVIGIGSANIGQLRGPNNQRIMGITTVFLEMEITLFRIHPRLSHQRPIAKP